MTVKAMRDQEERIVQVNRKELIDVLVRNREKHLKNYEKAKAGYRSSLLKKIEESFANAQEELTNRHKKTLVEVQSLTDEKLQQQQERLVIVSAIYIDMKVPRCYAKEYDAAIDMAKWDVRETLELSHAEFQCFVRDVWEWSEDFYTTAMSYSVHQ